jgi:DnaJ-class molecular chaperone
MRDPYEVLGLSRTASEAEIKKAFRKAAKAHHPDRNANDPKAKDNFAEVNAAYEILSDPAKRAQFDRGEIDAEGKPRFQGFEGFSNRRGGFEADFEHFGFGPGGSFGRASSRGADDIFSQLFGDAFASARQGGRTRTTRSRGEDIAATLEVTLEEVAGEERKRISLPTGRDVDVVIPKGVSDGQVIRLRGLGRPGHGAEAGDLLLTIRILPHERFTAEGANLRLRVPVELDEAVLGGAIRVPTLSGAVEMKIPPMTSSGRTFRLRGNGLPTKNGRGDLLVTTEVKLPAQADEALLEYARKRRAEKVG